MATTVVDALVVTLGLDPRQFTEGQRAALAAFKQTQEQATDSAKIIEAQGKKTTEYFSGLKREALTLLTVFLGGRGIKDFVSYITNLDAVVGRTAKSLGMSTEALSAWRNVAEQTGGTAEGITGTLHGLDREMNTFLLTGQSSKMPIFRQLGLDIFNTNNQLKTSGELLLDLIDKTANIEPRRRGAILSMAGVDEATINAILTLGPAYRNFVEQEMKHAVISKEDAQAAFARQKSFSALEQSVRSLGRSVLTFLTPAITGIMDKIRVFVDTDAKHFFKTLNWEKFGHDAKTALSGIWDVLKELHWKQLGSDIKDFTNTTLHETAVVLREIADTVKTIHGFFSQDLGGNEAGSQVGKFLFGATTPGSMADRIARATLGPKMADALHDNSISAEEEAYIRKSAIARGINPDVAMQVVASEGKNSYVGDQGTSFGRFQLHYKSNIPGFTNSGLGDEFTKQTGLDARDPSTWKAQDDFALDRAKKGGWSPWHGWKGLPFEGITGMGAPAAAATSSGAINNQNRTTGDTTHHSEVHVGNVNVASSKADPRDVAREVPDALKRANWAASANYSLTG